eukprot:GDKI01026178.1.p1 GENE.GDKI01026178.1~~GDKI01026178.1.p1  ORF type:complete len:363 (-),score=116.91 GDKI01026178.1:232-1320(-)
MSREFVVFFCPEFEQLADEMCALHPSIHKGSISWGKFEDGFPNISIENWNKHLRGKHVVFLASFLLEHTTCSIFDQVSVIYTFPRSLAASLQIVLPYFPTGTMERVEHEGQIATAKTLARILSATPNSFGTGPATLVNYDIHALQERFYFSDNIVPVFLTAIPAFIEALQADKEQDGEIAIAFPDEGARKRFGKIFERQKYEIIVCSKVRDGDKRVIKITEGNPVDKHVYIVDDLIKTGGTLIECAKALRKAGARHVSAYVTHGVFPQDSWKRFLWESPEVIRGSFDATPSHTNPPPMKPETSNSHPPLFRNFYITNSCPQMAKIVQGHAPFKVLTLAPSLVEFLVNEQSTKYFASRTDAEH